MYELRIEERGHLAMRSLLQFFNYRKDYNETGMLIASGGGVAIGDLLYDINSKFYYMLTVEQLRDYWSRLADTDGELAAWLLTESSKWKIRSFTDKGDLNYYISHIASYITLHTTNDTVCSDASYNDRLPAGPESVNELKDIMYTNNWVLFLMAASLVWSESNINVKNIVKVDLA